MLKPNLETKTITLDKVIKIVENEVAHFMTEKDIELVKDIKLASVNLKIDEVLLIRVIANLVNNAIKFSFSDSKIQFSIYEEAEKVYIKVIDQGIGFEMKNSEKMFLKFSEMGRLGTFNESSTGIGLYLCRQIIERNNGVLIASSEGENKGATFTVIFNKDH